MNKENKNLLRKVLFKFNIMRFQMKCLNGHYIWKHVQKSKNFRTLLGEARFNKIPFLYKIYISLNLNAAFEQ